jgi:hypothetical protein
MYVNSRDSLGKAHIKVLEAMCDLDDSHLQIEDIMETSTSHG